jgi:peroxiredoxin
MNEIRRRARWSAPAARAARLGLLLGLVVAIVLAGCGETALVRGGESTLPGPLPAGAEIAPERTDAAVAPRFNLTLVDGAVVDMGTLWADRPVLLFFFSSWCGTCADQEAYMAEIVGRYGDAIPVIGIAGQDTPGDVTTFLDEHAVDHPVGFDSDDGRIWDLYGVAEPPLVAVVGPGGRLLRGYPGGADPEILDAILAELVSLD